MNSVAKILFRFFLHPVSRYVLAWLAAVAVTAFTFYWGWTVFNNPVRRGGNNGHTMIDFGGQWLLGGMMAHGYGWHLYHRNYQWVVIREAYPREEETPAEDRRPEEKDAHDAENIMSWIMGRDEPETVEAAASFLTPLAAGDPLGAAALAGVQQATAAQRLETATAPQVGGPLYPPVHALLMAPLGQLRPQQAYRVVQASALVLTLLAGWGIRVLSRGRIWLPVAVTIIVIYPGFSGSLNLGHNSALALAILIWGWVMIARGRPLAGGVIWGLFAFKPVWAAAFFLVPLITGRWRVCLAMLATGTGLALLTLPFVGLHSWWEWLQIGREATATYKTDENWVFLSRDLLSIPRRWLVNFSAPPEERDNWAATISGWALLFTCVSVTVGLAWWRKDRRQVLAGPPAAFLLLGGWMSCFHFMYYDVLLTALPVLLLLAEPGRYFQRVLVGVMPIDGATPLDGLADYYQPRLTSAYPASVFRPLVRLGKVAILNSLTLSLLVLLWLSDLPISQLNISVSVSVPGLNGSGIPLPLKYSTNTLGTPWPTFCLLALWLWCGWQWLRQPQPKTEENDAQQPHLEVPARTAPVDAPQFA
jgi:hypothetical protein